MTRWIPPNAQYVRGCTLDTLQEETLDASAFADHILVAMGIGPASGLSRNLREETRARFRRLGTDSESAVTISLRGTRSALASFALKSGVPPEKLYRIRGIHIKVPQPVNILEAVVETLVLKGAVRTRNDLAAFTERC